MESIALSGKLTFNPMKDSLINENGEKIKLDPPLGHELPSNGFEVKDSGFQAPDEKQNNIEIVIDSKSDRLQLLSPFEEWGGKDLMDLKLLIKAKGKCTTDHISMAGPWLKYRGHLDNISNNLLIGATNAFNGEVNLIKNHLKSTFLHRKRPLGSYLNLKHY